MHLAAVSCHVCSRSSLERRLSEDAVCERGGGKRGGGGGGERGRGVEGRGECIPGMNPCSFATMCRSFRVGFTISLSYLYENLFLFMKILAERNCCYLSKIYFFTFLANICCQKV